MEKYKPYMAVILIQCSLAGMILFSKEAISAGMKPSVFIAYRQGFATVFLLPFAIFFQSKESPLTWIGLCKIFFASSFGLALSFNMNLAGLEYISATFGTAILCLSPVFVFIMALCLRIEKLAITEWHGMAKMLGALLGFSGTLVFTFYNGPALISGSQNKNPNSFEKTHTKQDWIKGSFLCIFGQVFYGVWLIMQDYLQKTYPGKLRLTILQSGFSCLTTTIYGAAITRNIHAWKLGWNISLLSIAYCGIIVTGISYGLQAWVIEKKGSVFVAIFGPLAVIFAAIVSAVFLKDTLHWGNVLGAGLLIAGLYSFLCGKNREAQKGAQQKLEISIEEIHV